jgi:hypothetical protein
MAVARLPDRGNALRRVPKTGATKFGGAIMESTVRKIVLDRAAPKSLARSGSRFYSKRILELARGLSWLRLNPLWKLLKTRRKL